jgi:hypothetical protein
MPKTLRTLAELPDADLDDLRVTHRALTGNEAPHGLSRDALAVRVTMAIMSAQDADAHTGVPRGTTGRVLTTDELAEKLRRKPQYAAAGARDIADGIARDTVRATVPPGAIRTDLNFKDHTAMARTRKAAAPAPAPEAAAPSAGRKLQDFTIRVKPQDDRPLRPEGMRAKIVALALAKPGKKITLSELNATLGKNVRGDVKVLIAAGHAEELQ